MAKDQKEDFVAPPEIEKSFADAMKLLERFPPPAMPYLNVQYGHEARERAFAIERARRLPRDYPLGPKQIQLVLDAVTVKLPFERSHCSFRVVDVYYPHSITIESRLEAVVPERDSGKPIPFGSNHRETVPLNICTISFVLRQVVQRAVRLMMEHEADEAILFCDERPFDPHRSYAYSAPPIEPVRIPVEDLDPSLLKYIRKTKKKEPHDPEGK